MRQRVDARRDRRGAALEPAAGEKLSVCPPPTAARVYACDLPLWLNSPFVRIGKLVTRRRGRAQPNSLRTPRAEMLATLLDERTKAASELVGGDCVVIQMGGVIPRDGTVIEGVAMVDQSAITGESAPVIRESANARSAVIAGSGVLSGRLVIEV